MATTGAAVGCAVSGNIGDTGAMAVPLAFGIFVAKAVGVVAFAVCPACDRTAKNKGIRIIAAITSRISSQYQNLRGLFMASPPAFSCDS